jgi:hypothetical protein
MCSYFQIYIGCWASSGYNVQGCAALEQQLRACMDAPVSYLAICSLEGPFTTAELPGVDGYDANGACEC